MRHEALDFHRHVPLDLQPLENVTGASAIALPCSYIAVLDFKGKWLSFKIMWEPLYSDREFSVLDTILFFAPTVVHHGRRGNGAT